MKMKKARKILAVLLTSAMLAGSLGTPVLTVQASPAEAESEQAEAPAAGSEQEEQEGQAEAPAAEAEQEGQEEQEEQAEAPAAEAEQEEQAEAPAAEAEQEEQEEQAEAPAAEAEQAAKEQKRPGPAADPSEADVIIEQNGVVICKSTPAVESAEAVDESAPRFTVLSDALDYVREGAIAREETVSINVPEEVFEQLDLSQYTDVLAHTGDPRGGDYLRCALSNYGASYSWTDDGEYWVEYYFYYNANADEEAEADAEVERLISSLGLKDESKSDYDKVKAIHDYIVENVEYDYDTFNGVTTDYWETYTGYGAIVMHLAVCQGFSAMFYRLCLEAGIDARIIDSREMGHAWNIVQLDGLYYLMDCTWDENTETDHYFLCGKYDFADHANSDDQFHDEAFAAKYPLSDYKYGHGSDSLGKAPDYTLITTDGRTVSTAAENGRAKVLIFFLDGCGRFLDTVNSLSGKEYDGVDFVYVNMVDYGTEQLQDIISQIGDEMPADVPGTYALCSNGSNARAEFEEIAGLDDGSGYVYSASVFLIDPDNEIVFAENAYGGEIGTLVERILEDPDLPDAPDPGDDPYAGFTEIGLCGKNAVWRFYGGDGGAYSKGTLLINGNGRLWDNNDYYTSIGWLTEDMTESDSCAAQIIQAGDVKRVIIGDAVTHIGASDFEGFTSLASITFKGTAPAINSGHGMTRNIRIYYPDYEPSWKNVNRDLFPAGCKWISQDADGVHHHKLSGGTVTKKATCTEDGSKEGTCSECGDKVTETIPATGHKWAEEYTVDRKPTKTEEGVESIHCLVCDAIQEGSERTIPPKAQEPQELTIEPASYTVVMGKTVTVTVNGAQGDLTCEAEDPSVASADVSGTTITVTGVNTGSTKLIVRAAETADYEAGEAEFELNVVPGKTTRGDMFNLANNVKVTWLAVPGAKYYKVYRIGVTDPGESLSDPVIVTTGLVGWDKSPGLTNGHAYRYRIVASATGAGDPSGDSPLYYTKLMYRLKTVVIRSVKNTAPGKVTVKYDRSASGDSYVLQYCERQDMVGAKTKVVLGANTTSYVIGGLKKGKTYYISIRVRKKVNGIDYYTTFGVAKKVKITQ